MDWNSTYEAESFTVYSELNSKNSFYYDLAPKNAWGSQKLQISSNHPKFTSYSVALEFYSKELQIENFGAKLDRANAIVET